MAIFETPPLRQQHIFSTPRKQISLPFLDTASSQLATPQSEGPSSPDYNPTGLSLSLDTSCGYSDELSPYPVKHSYPTTPTSPVSSEVMLKYIPLSSLVDREEVIAQIDDAVIDPKFKFDVQKDKIVGRGSYSTVLECSLNGQVFAVKVPSSIKASKLVLKEMFNYRIIQNYELLHGIGQADAPVLNVYGLTFMGKSDLTRIRSDEYRPCLVSEQLSCSLEKLISKSTHPDQLHIGNDLWWRLAHQLMSALQLFRHCHIVHMDLKPSNVLFNSTTGDFKVCDFSSAGLLEDIHAEHERRIHDGVFYDLTLQYCAPELAKLPPSSPSHHTDLYAVGLTLLYAATGEQPYAEILNTGSSFIYLNECIKKNKVLEFMSHQGLKKLKSDSKAMELIKSIIKRESWEACLEVLNT